MTPYGHAAYAVGGYGHSCEECAAGGVCPAQRRAAVGAMTSTEVLGVPVLAVAALAGLWWLLRAAGAPYPIVLLVRRRP